MTIIGLIFAIVVIALLVWGIDYLPIPPPFKRLVQGLVIILFALWLGEQLGVFGPYPLTRSLNRPIGR